MLTSGNGKNLLSQVILITGVFVIRVDANEPQTSPHSGPGFGVPGMVLILGSEKFLAGIGSE